MSTRQPRVAVAYLQLEPRAPRPYGAASWQSGEATVVRCTSKAPDPPLPGVVVVKVRIRVPAEAWEPITPEAVIDVPLDLVQRPVVVEAVDPS